jgi:hypothetical protein
MLLRVEFRRKFEAGVIYICVLIIEDNIARQLNLK